MTPRGGWRRWLATALLFVAFAALTLQAQAHVLPAEHMTHANPAAAVALQQGCDHAHAAAECVQPTPQDHDACCGGAAAQDDCCDQFCTIAALLPEGARAGPPPGGEAHLGVMADRVGRAPEGFLRPPRSSIAA